ncbi:MAG TPA: hypothetical protein VLF63_03700 [Patescibacteria group bacterium]|nr:hypothetical protein [Patescibacteria group bacterium]
MKIRSELASNLFEVETGRRLPQDYMEIYRDVGAYVLNPELYSPINGGRLAQIREHITQKPEAVLLNAYQAVTEIDLKYPSKSPEAIGRYKKGLRNEVTELVEEFDAAILEHPYHQYEKLGDDSAGLWLSQVLDFNRLRFADISHKRKIKIEGELGDVMWYCARLAADHDITLSDAFLSYLAYSDAPGVRDAFALNEEKEFEWARNNLDFKLTQDISLSHKFAYFRDIQVGKNKDRKITVDSGPSQILSQIIDEDLSGELTEQDLAITVGKLVWFVAYVSSSLINGEFADIIKDNLLKNIKRSQEGTIFNKEDRDELDEIQLRGRSSLRHPISHLVDDPNSDQT